MFGGGDLMSQKLEGRDELDFGRLARMTAWGTLFAPIAHTWYNTLDKVIVGKGAMIVASKVAADQLVFTVRQQSRASHCDSLAARVWAAPYTPLPPVWCSPQSTACSSLPRR